MSPVKAARFGFSSPLRETSKVLLLSAFSLSLSLSPFFGCQCFAFYALVCVLKLFCWNGQTNFLGEVIDKLSSDGFFFDLAVAFCAAFVSETTNRFQYTTDQLELSTVFCTHFLFRVFLDTVHTSQLQLMPKIIIIHCSKTNKQTNTEIFVCTFRAGKSSVWG